MSPGVGYVCQHAVPLSWRQNSTFQWKCSSSMPRTLAASVHTKESSAPTASPLRQRRGGLTPEFICDRRERQESDAGSRMTLVAEWGGAVLAKSSQCEVRCGLSTATTPHALSLPSSTPCGYLFARLAMHCLTMHSMFWPVYLQYVEGRFYFPESSVRWEYFAESGHQAMHNPVGSATYYDIVVPGVRPRNRRAAWCYRNLKRQWRIMEGRTTFWKGVAFRICTMDDGKDQEV